MAILALCCIAAATPLLAVKASPDPVWLEQPDGTRFEARQWGDEWLHGFETAEGYSVVRDGPTGWWSYAVRSADGALVPSPATAGIDPPPADLPRFLRPSGRPVERAARLRATTHGIGPARQAAVTGTRNVPVILVNFADRTPTYSTGQFQQLLFGTGTWSMRDYYSEVSYGQFTVAAGPAGVRGWYTASQGHDYYGGDNAEGDDMWPGDLVYEAVSAADAAGVNFAPYDNDGDCYVDVVTVIFQGGAEDGSGIATDIWSKRWSLSASKYWGKSHYDEYTTNDACPAGGLIKVNSFTLQGELYGTGMNTVGVFAHEYGHALGLPDLYDIDDSSEGIGSWSLMSSGSWCRVSVGGDRPCHLDPWSKYGLGWVTPQPVTTTRTSEAITAASSAADVYQFLYGSPTLGGEYFLVENRQKSGFDTGAPGAGLLVWHIDEARATTDNTDNTGECYPGGPSCAAQHYRVALVQADNNWDLERNVNRGDAGDPFPGTSGKTAFDASSSPNSSLYSGAASGVAITSIGASGTTMTATLAGSGGGGSQTVTILSDGFEGSFPGSWLTYPSGAQTAWGKSTYRKVSGSYGLWCAAGGTSPQPAGGQYASSMNTWFYHGPFSLADASAATVEFDLWYETEKDYDFFKLLLSVNGTNFHGYQWSGSSNGWQHVTVNLADITAIQAIGAPQVWLAGVFTSDESLQYEGAYVDNLVLRKTVAGQSCTYLISPTSQSFAAAGGTGSVSVTASGTGCSWSATSGAGWVTITSGASGTGNGTVSYSVAANSSTSSRSGTLTIAGQTFTVSQSGAASCTYSISPTSRSHAASASTGTVSVTASAAGCAWTATSGVGWVTITGGTSGAGNGTVTYSVAANSSASSRSGTLTIAGQSFTVTQSGASGGGTTYRYLIPAIAHSPGANYTAWRSDVSIVNRSGSSAQVTVAYTSNTDSMSGNYSATMPNGAALSWQDVLSSLYGLAQSGVNQGTIQITSTAPLCAVGRTYNQTATATFGQAYPAVAVGEAISVGRTAILPHLSNNAAYRTNLGIVSLGTGACTVTVRLYNGSGTQIGNPVTIAADPGKFAQNNGIFANAGAGQQDTGYAVVSTDSASCSFWAFATVVDNVSGDPTTIEMFPM